MFATAPGGNVLTCCSQRSTKRPAGRAPNDSPGSRPRQPRRARTTDDTLVIVLNNGDEEIERGIAPAGDAALGVALMMLARRGELRPGDTLRVLAPS